MDLTTASGTGPARRIVRADIDDVICQLGAAQPMPQPAATPPTDLAEPASATPAVLSATPAVLPGSAAPPPWPRHRRGIPRRCRCPPCAAAGPLPRR
ncbi:MAG: hypothetical protein ACR2MP_26705 [Streptosporangiaceae bacterium]